MDDHRARTPDYLTHTEGAQISDVATAVRPLRVVPLAGGAGAPVVRVGPRKGKTVPRPTERDRRLIAVAVRHGRLVPSQAWRWEWPASPTNRPARNRLSELAVAGWLVHVPLRR